MNDKMAMPVWSIGLFLVLMNTTMFNVSLPTIIHELHITAGLGSWIVSGYSIVFALSTITFSRLSDFVPIRTLLLIGPSILAISSVIGYASHSFDILLAARLLQASGAGSVPALARVFPSRYVPYKRRGRAIALISSAAALAFGLGPVIGGAITEIIGWNELFLVNCLVIPLIPILWRTLPKESLTESRFDIFGALLTTIMVSALLVAVTQMSLLFLLTSLAALLVNIWHLRRIKEPFIQPVLFRNRGYRKLLFIAFCAFVLNMSMLFLIPLVLADVFHKDAATIGMMVFPGAVLSAFLNRWVGRWIDRYGNYRCLLLGHISLFIAMIVIVQLIHVSALIVLIGYLIFAPSFSAVTSSLTNEISRILPEEYIGSGMGLTQLFQYFGGSFGVAACGILMVWQRNQPLISAYRHIYLLLLLVVLASLLLLIWYRKYMKSDVGYCDRRTLGQ